MENLPSDFFTRYANLKELDASRCQLTVLHESPWSTASKLRSLHLNGNELTVITNGTLASMKSIEYLNIQDLPLQILEVRQFFWHFKRYYIMFMFLPFFFLRKEVFFKCQVCGIWRQPLSKKLQDSKFCGYWKTITLFGIQKLRFSIF